MVAKDTTATKLAVMDERLKNIEEKVTRIDTQVSANYVTKQEFDPVKRLVYGLVSLILVGVVGAILGVVLVE